MLNKIIFFVLLDILSLGLTAFFSGAHVEAIVAANVLLGGFLVPCFFVRDSDKRWEFWVAGVSCGLWSLGLLLLGGSLELGLMYLGLYWYFVLALVFARYLMMRVVDYIFRFGGR